MGSVVIKDVAPYTVVAGTPAKVIKMRFEEDIIEALLKSKWWEMDDETLENLGKHFNDVDTFLKLYDS